MNSKTDKVQHTVLNTTVYGCLPCLCTAGQTYSCTVTIYHNGFRDIVVLDIFNKPWYDSLILNKIWLVATILMNFNCSWKLRDGRISLIQPKLSSYCEFNCEDILHPATPLLDEWNISTRFRIIAFTNRNTYGSAEGPPRGVENRNLLYHPHDIRQCPNVIRMRYGQELTHPDDLGFKWRYVIRMSLDNIVSHTDDILQFPNVIRMRYCR